MPDMLMSSPLRWFVLLLSSSCSSATLLGLQGRLAVRLEARLPDDESLSFLRLNLLTAAEIVLERHNPNRRDVSVERRGGDDRRFNDPVLATDEPDPEDS